MQIYNVIPVQKISYYLQAYLIYQVIYHRFEFFILYKQESIFYHHFVIKVQSYFQSMQAKHKLEDYKVVRLIGKGSFGEIYLVNRNSQSFALKKISKKKIIKVNKLHQPFVEREILFRFKEIAPDYFVNIYQTHSDNDYIYMILQYCDGSSMETIIGKLDQIENKYYVIKRIIVKMVLILEVMHRNGVIHRDLKPGNFLFKKNGTIKLADFGTAFAKNTFFSPEVAAKIQQYRSISKKKQIEKMEGANQSEQLSTVQSTTSRRATFVGTPLYMAPQLLEEDFSGPESDLWALGCIIYQLINSKPPFYDENQGMVWKKILNDDYKEGVKIDLNGDAKQLKDYQSLIKQLLNKNRMERLGFGQNGYENIKKHSFFKNVDWQAERNRPIKQISQFLQKNSHSSNNQYQGSKKEEKVVFSGVVNKKMFFGFKDRMLVLHSTPKLVYYDMETGQKKGQIQVANNTPVELEGSKTFTVTNSKKTYYFKTPKAAQWVQMIKFAMVNAFY